MFFIRLNVPVFAVLCIFRIVISPLKTVPLISVMWPSLSLLISFGLSLFCQILE